LALLEGLGPPEDEMPVPDRARHWIESIAPARSKAPRAYPSTQAAARRLQEHDSRLRHEFAERLAELGTRALANGSRVFKHDPLHVTRGPYPFRVDFARSFWQRVQCPVLLVEGSESPFSQLADREQRMAAFANARRQVIAGAGHLMQRHEPAALCRVLRDFLDGET
jgi:pimeloyl-ACP methyl ester carboxylesterase